jgi:hypothetical protein
VVFNGGGDGVQRCSGSKDSFGGDGVGGGSSSKHQIRNGGSGVAARRRRRGSEMASRVWAKFALDRALFKWGSHAESWIAKILTPSKFESNSISQRFK